jgi:hypothetical protein
LGDLKAVNVSVEALFDRRPKKPVTMAKAVLSDGQTLCVVARNV